jgi:hypothetical protein
MDKLKLVTVVAVLSMLVTLGAIVFIAQDAINGAKIPDAQRGMVISKAPVTDNQPANYTVTLPENKLLYIVNNPALYESIVANKTYLFDCRIDLANKMTIIESASLVPES